MTQRIPLALIPARACRFFARPLRPMINTLGKLLPNLEQDLIRADTGIKAAEYLDTMMINSLFFLVLFFGLFVALLIRVGLKPLQESLITGGAYSIATFLLVLLLFIRYPHILAGKRSEAVERYLIFALKEVLLQVSSGISLYTAILNISKQKYGAVSDEFGIVARDVNAGMPLEKAFERLALRTTSPFLQRTVWQLVNGMRAGSAQQGVLRVVINDATVEKRTKIRDFAQELNLWGLLYMTFAVAVPSIGMTMMIILSTFGGAGVTASLFIFFIVGCFIIQFALIGFIKTRRPVVSV